MKDMDPVTRAMVERYEAGVACLESFILLIQLTFVLIKVQSHSAENAIQWAVVFIPGYIFYLIWFFAILYIPHISGAWHVWYLWHPWMIMFFTWMTTGMTFCMIVAHLQDWWRPGLEWGLFIPVMGLALYLFLLFGYLYLSYAGWFRKRSGDDERVLTGSEYVSMNVQETQSQMYD